jgi:hypothetical protein
MVQQDPVVLEVLEVQLVIQELLDKQDFKDKLEDLVVMGKADLAEQVAQAVSQEIQDNLDNLEIQELLDNQVLTVHLVEQAAVAILIQQVHRADKF